MDSGDGLKRPTRCQVPFLEKHLAMPRNRNRTLMNYLLVDECQISNNLAERSIRPFVVGRKAWNFYASPKGAESSGIAYSIIETAKANNLNVFKYLTYLFKELPNTPFKEESDLLEDYLPQESRNSSKLQITLTTI